MFRQTEHRSAKGVAFERAAARLCLRLGSRGGVTTTGAASEVTESRTGRLDLNALDTIVYIYICIYDVY